VNRWHAASARRLACTMAYLQAEEAIAALDDLTLNPAYTQQLNGAGAMTALSGSR